MINSQPSTSPGQPCLNLISNKQDLLGNNTKVLILIFISTEKIVMTYFTSPFQQMCNSACPAICEKVLITHTTSRVSYENPRHTNCLWHGAATSPGAHGVLLYAVDSTYANERGLEAFLAVATLWDKIT